MNKPFASIAVLHQIAPEFRGDEIARWAQLLRRTTSKEEGSKLVREGLRGFKNLDSNAKALLRMSYCEALLNRNEPEAIKFVENTARMNSNNPNVLTNLLKGVSPDGALIKYPELSKAATQWFSANKEIRYDSTIRAFRSEDPAVMKSIEGGKFVTFQVDQMKEQLARLSGI